MNRLDLDTDPYAMMPALDRQDAIVVLDPGPWERERWYAEQVRMTQDEFSNRLIETIRRMPIEAAEEGWATGLTIARWDE